ncbi:MAG: VPS10 domain-containing protein [Candidatus Omnitrophota bacterium]
MKNRILTLLLGLSLLSMAALASPNANDPTASAPEARLRSYQKHLQMKADSPFKILKWKELGPYYLGGRITDIEGYVNDPHKYYIASASGGLWFTENNGTSWTPLFDNESSITIGDIAVSQSDENLLWVGTGEPNASRSSYAGTGVFKSIDGGKTWKNMGLTDTHHIARILIDPVDNHTVYVAAIGHLYTDNDQRGLFKTTDGGLTWKKILSISPKTGIIDVVMHPENPRILYAASWQKDRKAWNFEESGEESAVFKSVDAGQTWTKIMNGLPQGKYVGRIGLAIAPSKPNVVYAYIDNQEPKPGIKDDKSSDANKNLFNTTIKGGEVYRSDNGGDTWTRTHTQYLDGLVYTYGYYFGQIRVAPDNENIIYLLGVPLMVSTDGGKTVRDIFSDETQYDYYWLHADLHALWIHPKNPKQMLLGTDGGLNVSYDRGTSWQRFDNLPLSQCYTIQFDNREPYNIYSGLQDNGVNMGPSDYALRKINCDWKLILGGDGAFVQPQPDNPDTVYAAIQFGSIFRLEMNTKKRTYIKPQSPDKNVPYRFNWLSPFLVSSHNPLTLYMGANKVLKSVNRGENWCEISPDLTNEKNTGGDVPYATITALDESPLSPDLLVAGTDDGHVWVKKDAHSLWEKVTNGLPAKWVSRVTASQYKKERIYLSLTGYREDDFRTYVYVSENYGKTWRAIQGNLPEEEPVNVIREDPVNENVLYLGTDLGIYVSLDRGTTWHALKNNLPTNAVYDLRVHPTKKELIIGTHGRGVFLLPIDHIERLTPDVLKKKMHVFPITDAWPSAGPYSPGQPLTVYFYRSESTRLTIEITDKSGKKIQTAQTLEINAANGLNRWDWDLMLDKEKKTTLQKGEYTITLINNNDKIEGSFKVIDPR